MPFVPRRAALDRRTFLRGAGAMIGLPLLDAMQPAFAARPAPPPGLKGRAVFVFLPNGMHMPDWTPADTGVGFTLPPLLQPLAPYRKRVSVLSGLDLDAALAHGDGPGDHARSGATFLTCTHPLKTGGAGVRVGTSIDQLIAQKLVATTKLPSLELGCEAGRAAGDCDSGYACAYVNNVSWSTPTTPTGKETKPRTAFIRLFGDPEGDSPELRAGRRGVLDLAREEAKRLQASLGGADRAKLDEYLTSVRAFEKRLEAEEKDSKSRAPGKAPGTPKDYQEHVRQMYDLIALAFRADLTRVASFMPANAGSNRSYAFIGAPEGHHDLSHHGRDPEKQKKVARINRFHMEEFARFLGALAEANDGDATLLDRSSIVLGSGISDGDRHNHDDLPILLCGGGDGALKLGKHVRYARKTPLANLHLTLADRMNVRLPTFADATGRLDV